MSQIDAESTPLAHAVAARAADGESRCGDHWVVESDGRATLLSVIDGLGHGEHAETAARIAGDVVRQHARADLLTVMTETNRALRATRGAAVSLARIGSGRLQWLAVGNVQGVICRATAGTTSHLVARGGIVGSRLPRMQVTETSLVAGDVLAMYTDGVNDHAGRDLASLWEPRILAPWLLDRHATGSDDALVLVAKQGRVQP